MQITNLDYDEHKGRIAIGRVHAGRMRRGLDVKVQTPFFYILRDREMISYWSSVNVFLLLHQSHNFL